MAKSRKHKGRTFAEMSARQRKRAVISTKNAIRTDGDCGLFYTPHAFDGENCEIDIWFIGKNKTPTSATISNTRAAYIRAVGAAAGRAADALVPTSEIVRPREDFEVMMRRMDEPRPEYEGLSYFRWRRREETRIAEAKTIEVFEQVRIASKVGGFDLRVIVDAPVITHELVVAFIRDIQANGIKVSQGTRPFCFGFDAECYEANGNVVPHCGPTA